MSYDSYKRSLEREIEALNWLIDDKIMHGVSYRHESRQHKELIKQARKMRHKSFFSRLAFMLF